VTAKHPSEAFTKMGVRFVFHAKNSRDELGTLGHVSDRHILTYMSELEIDIIGCGKNGISGKNVVLTQRLLFQESGLCEEGKSFGKIEVPVVPTSGKFAKNEAKTTACPLPMFLPI
jgi:hypothetical protein